MISKPCVLLLGLGAWLGACGGSDDGGNSSTTRYIGTCNNLCAEAARCSSTVNEVQCGQDCQDSLAVTGPNLSSAYLAEYDACASSGDCAQLTVEVVATSICANRARVRTDPTPTVESFCDGVAAEDDRCGRAPRRALCVEGLKIFSDAALTRARTCLSEPCDRQQPCVEEELGANLG